METTTTVRFRLRGRKLKVENVCMSSFTCIQLSTFARATAQLSVVSTIRISPQMPLPQTAEADTPHSEHSGIVPDKVHSSVRRVSRLLCLCVSGISGTAPGRCLRRRCALSSYCCGHTRRRMLRLCSLKSCARLVEGADDTAKAVIRDERLALQLGARLRRGVLGAEPLRDGSVLTCAGYVGPPRVAFFYRLPTRCF